MLLKYYLAKKLKMYHLQTMSHNYILRIMTFFLYYTSESIIRKWRSTKSKTCDGLNYENCLRLEYKAINRIIKKKRKK